MVFVNHSTQQMAAKVVYYGPGLCGKTTNLQWIFDNTKADSRGEMVSMATETDRTLFFDLLPIELGKIGDLTVRVQLYTVPGQVFYNSTRKLVLRGVDGVVFVADSQPGVLDANLQSLDNLAENLAEISLSIETIPLVLQLNKRDLDDCLPVEQLDAALNRHDWPVVEAAAVNGMGVVETLKAVSKVTLRQVRKKLAAAGQLGAKPAAAPAPATPPAIQAAPAPPPAAPPPVAPPPVAPLPAAPPPAAPQPVPASPPVVSDPVASAAPKPVGSRPPVLRFPEAFIHDRLSVGKACPLRVALNRRPRAGHFESLYRDDEGAFAGLETSLDVVVTAVGFELPDGDHQALALVGDQDSEPIHFKLIPRRSGRKRIKVELFHESRYVGGVAVETEVVAGEIETPPTTAGGFSVLDFDPEAEPPDLTLLITETRSNEHSRSYSFTLHSPENGLFYLTLSDELRLYGSPVHWMRGLFADLAALGASSDPAEVATTLNAIGADLYEKLFPRGLKQIWKENIRGKVKTALIVSDEPWIPWELVKPHYEDGAGGVVEDDFLCAGLLLGRWLSGSPPPSTIEVSSGALVLPSAASKPHVLREGQFLESLGGVKAIESRKMAIQHLLSFGSFDLIHFTADGSFGAEAEAPWQLHLEEGDRLAVSDIISERENFGAERPFIFLNACRTQSAGSGEETALVGLDAWAGGFLGTMVGGFLGTAWQIGDDSASRFSTTFYSALREGHTVTEALRVARTEIRALPTSTWLAYRLYADPLARVRFTGS